MTVIMVTVETLSLFLEKMSREWKSMFTTEKVVTIQMWSIKCTRFHYSREKWLFGIFKDTKTDLCSNFFFLGTVCLSWETNSPNCEALHTHAWACTEPKLPCRKDIPSCNVTWMANVLPWTICGHAPAQSLSLSLSRTHTITRTFFDFL